MSTACIALVGNPNCGKTALFNALTGARHKVANYPGVTVERKEGSAMTPAGREVRFLDLPGTYSLRARSPDEEVTRDAVLGRIAGEELPDLLVCVADATNLRQVLRLVLELKHAGQPMVLALNMFDIARHRGIEIDIEKLSATLGMPVVPTVAVRKGGTQALLEQLDTVIADENLMVRPASWQEPDAVALRAAHKQTEAILADCVKRPGGPDKITRSIDRVLLNPAAGLVILFTLLFLMFQAVFAWAQPAMDGIKDGMGALGEFVGANLPEGMLRGLLTDGIIAGVGSVLVFLPQILILFLFIILLEDCGYMARAAVLMDRIMGRAGLHGRAFIPLLSSFACAIPGVMATRVIESRRDRIATILVAPLVTCSARIPVYTLIIAAFIPAEASVGPFGLQGVVMFALYAIGIGAALGVAWLLKLTVAKGEIEPFLLELPSYRWPRVSNVLIGLYERAKIFLSRAGTVILSIMVLIWFLCSVPGAPEGATEPAINYSIAGIIGHWLEPLLRPIGFTWEITLALIPGMAAREVAVAALGTVFAVQGSGEENIGALTDVLAHAWTLPTALALLAWYVFAPQCASTLAVVKRETNSWRWPLFMFGYMVTLAYIAAGATYWISRALLG